MKKVIISFICITTLLPLSSITVSHAVIGPSEARTGFTPEVIFYVTLKDPATVNGYQAVYDTASWALLVRTSENLSGKSVNVKINGVEYQIEDPSAHVSEYDGLLIDYDETLKAMTASPELSVEVLIDGKTKATATLTNWDFEGVITIPNDHLNGHPFLYNDSIIVAELDDVDPSDNLRSSFTDIIYGEQYYKENGDIISGLRQNDSNAIDITFRNIDDYSSKIFLSFNKRMELIDYEYWLDDYGKIETNIQFNTNISALVQDHESNVVLAPIIWRIGHLEISEEEMPSIYDGIIDKSLSAIPSNTIFGVVHHQDVCRSCYAVANIGLYVNHCFSSNSEERCAWQNPGHDSYALILPLVRFFKRQDVQLVMDVFLRGNPVLLE